MSGQIRVLTETVRDLLASGDVRTAVAAVDGLHPSDLAVVLSSLERHERVALCGVLGASGCAAALWELDDDPRAETVSWLDDDLLASMLEELPDDGAADVLQEMPDERRARLLRRVRPGRVSSLERLLGHEESTAGGLMSPRFVGVDPSSRVADALEVLRSHRDTEFVYYVYGLSPAGAIVGVTSLRDLVVADPGTLVGDLLRTDSITVTPETDQEEVARLASRYDLLAIPVVASDGRMLGVVTADDVLEVLSSEAEEDLERVAGSVETEPHRRGLWSVVRARVPWAIGTLVVELAIAYLLLRPLPARARGAFLAFLPLLLFTGSSAAISATGVVLRRLVRGDSAIGGLLAKEAQAGVLLGLLAAAGSTGLLILAGQASRTASVVGIAVGGTVLVSSTVGSVAPVALRAAGRDPALASGPLLGVLADGAALAVYVLAARLLL